MIRFGERVATEVSELGLQCEREPPQLLQYDAWGNRVDQLITSPAWKRQHNISAEEGLIASAYEGKYGEWRYLISHNIYPLSYVYILAPTNICVYINMIKENILSCYMKFSNKLQHKFLGYFVFYA